MKKTLFTLAILFYSGINLAQEKMYSYALQIGFWNFYAEEYEWEEVKNCDVVFFLQGDVIIANDEAKSTYYTYECVLQSKEICRWKAYDESKRKCAISMIFGKTNFFIVTYNDICYRYSVNF